MSIRRIDRRPFDDGRLEHFHAAAIKRQVRLKFRRLRLWIERRIVDLVIEIHVLRFRHDVRKALHDFLPVAQQRIGTLIAPLLTAATIAVEAARIKTAAASAAATAAREPAATTTAASSRTTASGAATAHRAQLRAQHDRTHAKRNVLQIRNRDRKLKRAQRAVRVLSHGDFHVVMTSGQRDA